MKVKYTIIQWIEKYRKEITEINQLEEELKKYWACYEHILSDIYEYIIINDSRFIWDIRWKEVFEIEDIKLAEFYFNS